MCYSALVHAEFKRFVRQFGARVDFDAYLQRYWIDAGRDPSAGARRRPRAPRAMERELLADAPAALAALVRRWDADETTWLEQEVFAQTRRRADAERRLAVKETKKAREDVRIAGARIARAKARLATLKGAAGRDDGRIYPQSLCPVLVVEDGQRVVRPMRYQCRLPGWTEAVERRYPGTYNARRDKLDTAWRGVFGHTHGLVIASAFYEHVERDGQDVVLEFRPEDGRDMLVACLYTRCTDDDGRTLYTFAAITDEPPAEVAAAGHDRCIVPIRPDAVDAWLNPSADALDALHAVLEDRERPLYAHRLAA